MSSDDARPPREPLPRLFLRFLRFGALAWGGPVAQIGMLQKELVEEERWISPERFNRTLAVYQALPGPEAHEMCVFFGTLARGRAGGLVAGLGFMLPGFLLMLLLSWAHVAVGLTWPPLAAAFAGCQAAVVALVARAAHRIGAHALRSAALAACGVAALSAALLGAPFLLILGVAGLAGLLAARGRQAIAIGALVMLVVAAASLPAFSERAAGPDGAAPPEAGVLEKPGTARLFLAGLKTGCLTFGGAHTAVPILQRDAVERGRWLTDETFLDGIALGGILPAPLIIFATFVGFVAGSFAGALAITTGVFLPAFAFTLVGHDLLERVVHHRGVAGALDGVTAGVVGLIASTLVTLARASLTGPSEWLICALALAASYRLRARASVVVIIAGAAVLGSLLLRG